MPRRRALRSPRAAWLGVALLVTWAGVGCPDDPPGRPCDGNVDCPAGQRCDEDTFFCIEAPGDGDGDAGVDAGCLCATDDDCAAPEAYCDGVARCHCDRCEIEARCSQDSDAPACFEAEARCVQCLDDTHCAGHETPEGGAFSCDVPTMSCVLVSDGGS